LVRINVICPPIFTPDMLSVPAKLPTISISATLYRDWIMLDAKKGRANRTSWENTLPRERSVEI
jgi:hypothetical protein